MRMPKQHLEFMRLNMDEDWETPEGYPPEIQHKILAGRIDETSRAGNRTRLLRFAPGAFTTEAFVHTYWEEVFLLSGDLCVADDENNPDFTKYEGFTYACRPPGVYHGPFRSENGCLLLEVHFYP